jgi:twitching motility protein PilJ
MTNSKSIELKKQKFFLQWFYNLPIFSKQMVAFLLLEIMALGLVGIGALMLIRGLRMQLLQESKTELAVIAMSYASKLDEIKIGHKENVEDLVIKNILKTKYTKNTNIFELLFLDEILEDKTSFFSLVDSQTNIIASSGVDRKGKKYNPYYLVSSAIARDKQITSSESISYDELVGEDERLARLLNQNTEANYSNKKIFLVRYIVTPIKNGDKEILGALISREIAKPAIVERVDDILGHGYSAIYLSEPNGQFSIALDREKLDDGTINTNVKLADTSLLEGAIEAKGETVSKWSKLKDINYAMSAKALLNFKGEPIGVLVRGVCVNEINSLILQNLLLQALLLGIVLGISIPLARFLAKTTIQPIHHLRNSTFKFANGDRKVRAEVIANDEVGELAIAFNAMADSISAAEFEREKLFKQRQLEAEIQSQDKEKLQRSISKLLNEIIEAQQGNLAVRVSIEDGEIGSIADAFNLTIEYLRDIVKQVQQVTSSVQNSARHNETSVQKLSDLSNIQVEAISTTLYSVREMGQSIYLVADSAQEAADIAREALGATQTGEKMMSSTVTSIENIRASVAETSKKIKRLAESSQEISKIVNIITGISEKTNLLAFNASIEASRAGEHGHGFRVVADEVRRLAERITESAQDIEQIVSAIQKDTSEVMQTMENSTDQVVRGTKLVNKTKQTLQKLAQLSQQIDLLLQSISTSTVSQTEYSHRVTQTMEDVVDISKNTSTESQIALSSLQELVEVANELQNSISQFQV